MKSLLLCVSIVFCANLAYSQSEPTVAVDNIAVTHEHKGWRVTSVSTTPIHFNLIKGDLIVRIDGKNAAETGPMLMASLLNQGNRQQINLFIERGDLRMETRLREISPQNYDGVNADPFKHVTAGFSSPDADFKDIDGQPVTLEQFKGKWLIIDFMATWCAPCIETLPKVLSFADRHQMNLLMVALNDKPEAVRRMRQNYNINSPIAMMQATARLPIDFGVITNRWIGQVPGIVLIRPDGEIALIAIGATDSEHFDKTIECLMNCTAGDVSK